MQEVFTELHKYFELLHAFLCLSKWEEIEPDKMPDSKDDSWNIDNHLDRSNCAY